VSKGNLRPAGGPGYLGTVNFGYMGPLFIPPWWPAESLNPPGGHGTTPRLRIEDQMHLPRWFSHFAGTSGNDNTIDASVNGSATAADFYVQAPSDEKWLVNRMLVQLIDESTMEPEGDYGSLGSALTNGILIWREDADGTKVHDIVGSANPIKENADWTSYTHDVEVQNWDNTTNEAMSVRWDFAAAGAPIVLQPGEKIIVRVNDDLSNLIEHSFCFQGVSLAYRE
jgi:hypothetical protein